jgi:hypothetical protein
MDGQRAVGPGLLASARLALAALAMVFPCQAAFAQTPPAAATAASPAPVPDQLTSLKMLWSALAAVDHANRTGNYSVLRDLGSSGFQARNNPANLAAIFAGLRNENVDLSATLVVTPVWEILPTLVQPRVLRMRGTFPLRPAAIAFDLLFSWEDGWRLEGVAVQAQNESTASPSR